MNNENKDLQLEQEITAPEEAMVEELTEATPAAPEKKAKKKNIFQNRRFRHGTMATVMTAVFIVAVVLVNVVAAILEENISLSLDITENQVYALSDEMKDYLATVEKEVDIYVLTTKDVLTNQGGYFAQIAETFENVRKSSSKISVEYVDLDANPTFAQKFPKLDIQSLDVVYSCGDRTKVQNIYGYDQLQYTYTSDFLNIQTGESMYAGTTITSSKAEQAIATALMNVTSDTAMLVTLLTGHGETAPSGLEALLSDNGYDVETQSLLTETTINPESDFIVISSPTSDYKAEEIAAIETFLNNKDQYGKHLIFFAPTNKAELPVLKEFLAGWGISMGKGIAYETDSNKMLAGMLQYAPYFPFLSEDSTEVLSGYDDDVLVTGYARPLNLLFDANGSMKTYSLLSHPASTVVIPFSLMDDEDAAKDWTPENAEEKGPFSGATLTSRVRYEGTTGLYNHVVAFGSANFLDSTFTQQENISNAEYFVDLVNTMSGREETSITIASKSMGGNSFTVTETTANVMMVIFCIVLPLAILIAGFVIWLRRRHL